MAEAWKKNYAQAVSGFAKPPTRATFRLKPLWVLLRHGSGVAKEDTEAAKWYRQLPSKISPS